ncbi:indole-3-acetate beta-D-glucosyltransferase [Prunus dulcis]|uniref:Indole-3-acetate beta-D-glucosyltransferase n=1 Tax=Prunus dulcis TaxID=3755 RepID=A0A4Y1QNK4_PRUDU|nr:indole-3-acetate beta-D-glucosyltransferase [Prunus dulcis]
MWPLTSSTQLSPFNTQFSTNLWCNTDSFPNVSGSRPHQPGPPISKAPHPQYRRSSHVHQPLRLSTRIVNGSTPNGLTYAPYSDGYDDGFNFSDDVDHYMSSLGVPDHKSSPILLRLVQKRATPTLA